MIQTPSIRPSLSRIASTPIAVLRNPSTGQNTSKPELRKSTASSIFSNLTINSIVALAVSAAGAVGITSAVKAGEGVARQTFGTLCGLAVPTLMHLLSILEPSATNQPSPPRPVNSSGSASGTVSRDTVSTQAGSVESHAVVAGFVGPRTRTPVNARAS